MRTTAIMNLKGGTAKTVTAINTAAILARDYGQRVLLVDADSQANLTEFVIERQNPDGPAAKRGLADLLKGFQVPLMESKLPGVHILPATDELMDLDVSKAGTGEADVMALSEFAEERGRAYDVMLIDCPPAFNAAAMAALIAADDVIIPMTLDAFGVRGLANMMHQVKCMQKINSALTVAGILPTMWYRTPAVMKAEDSLRETGLPVYQHISRSSAVMRSTFEQLPLIKSSPNCSACRDYRFFVGQYLRQGETEGGAV